MFGLVDGLHDAVSVEHATLINKGTVVDCLGADLHLLECFLNDVEHHSKQKHVDLDIDFEEVSDEFVLQSRIALQVEAREHQLQQQPVRVLPDARVKSFVLGQHPSKNLL